MADEQEGPKKPGVVGNLIPANEDAIAQAFVTRFENELRYNHTLAMWFRWDGGLWRPDEMMATYEQVREFLRDVRHKDRGKKKLVDAVERLARSDERIATTHEQWDRDPWLLGTPDGTVDLRTGELREGRPYELISKVTLVTPSDDAECPVFDEFIHFALEGNADNVAFLDRYFGYCLTGLTNEEFLLFLYGKEGTGKGTLTKTMMTIMHQHAKPVPIDMFTDKSGKQEYYRATLHGYRWIVAAEPEKGVAWNEGFVNEATGGDMISGRHPSGRPFSFDPTHKLLIHGNAVPDLKAAASGLKRRLGIIPFNHSPTTPDRGLKEKLRAEYPAILRRLINGCIDYQRIGLAVPPTVRAATIDYFDRQDRLSRFVNDMIEERKYVRLDTGRIRTGVLFQVYNSWAEKNGERRVNSSGFHDLVENSADPSIHNVAGRANQKFVAGLAEPASSNPGFDLD